MNKENKKENKQEERKNCQFCNRKWADCNCIKNNGGSIRDKQDIMSQTLKVNNEDNYCKKCGGDIFKSGKIYIAGSNFCQCHKQEELPKINRVEIINHSKYGNGRDYVIWEDDIEAEISMQDDGKTLKVFIKNSPKQEEVKECRCLQPRISGGKCIDCLKPTPNKGWEERLRDLYLSKSPDDEGMWTKSISFNWGKFEFSPTTNKQVEFYLTTKEGIEDFIRQELALQRESLTEELTDEYWAKRLKVIGEEARQELLAEIKEKIKEIKKTEIEWEKTPDEVKNILLLEFDSFNQALSEVEEILNKL